MEIVPWLSSSAAAERLDAAEEDKMDGTAGAASPLPGPGADDVRGVGCAVTGGGKSPNKESFAISRLPSKLLPHQIRTATSANLDHAAAARANLAKYEAQSGQALPTFS
jgi:hypothetical protein